MMNKKKSMNNLIINIIFATAFLQNFVVFSDRVFPLNDMVQLFFLMITIALIIFKIVQDRNIVYTLKKAVALFAIGIYFILNIALTGKINVHVLFILILIYMLNIIKKEQIEIKNINFYVIIGTISLVIQAILFRFEDGRIVNSFIDPNYSGFIYFLYFVFLVEIKYKKTSLIILLLGVLTLSRNFVLAVVIYFIFNSKKMQKIGAKFKNLSIILILSNLFLLFIGRIYIQIYEYKLQMGSLNIVESNNFGKIFEVFDKSNYYRFLANEKFLELLNHPTEFLFGTNIEWYKENIFFTGPHNYIGTTIINYGFIFLVISFVFMYIYMKSNDNNINIYFSLVVYYLFLGFGLVGYQLVFTIFILYISKEKIKKQKIINSIT